MNCICQKGELMEKLHNEVHRGWEIKFFVFNLFCFFYGNHTVSHQFQLVFPTAKELLSIHEDKLKLFT